MAVNRRLHSRDTFKVTITATVEKDKQGSCGPQESISYGQEFRIRAVGFTEVAAVLGRLDEAVGEMQAKYEPIPDPN